MDPAELLPVLEAVEKEYDLGSGFLLRLYQEDDWSFVVKAHALIEAATSQLLTHHTGDARLARVFERLELSNTQVGRLAFLKALDLLSDRERGFVRHFSELRNRLVHNVHSVRFRFADDLAAMNSQQNAAFAEWASSFVEKSSEGREWWRTTALESPKHTLWVATVFVVVSCLRQTRAARERHDRIDRALDVLQASGLEEEDRDETNFDDVT